MNGFSKEKNIQIPLPLFDRIVEFMDLITLPDNDVAIRFIYDDIKNRLNIKRISMLHRETYSKVVFAEDELGKKEALNNYLYTKEYYNNHYKRT